MIDRSSSVPRYAAADMKPRFEANVAGHREFAEILGRAAEWRDEQGIRAAFNRARNDGHGLTSFAAMPIVAPVATGDTACPATSFSTPVTGPGSHTDDGFAPVPLPPGIFRVEIGAKSLGEAHVSTVSRPVRSSIATPTGESAIEAVLAEAMQDIEASGVAAEVDEAGMSRPDARATGGTRPPENARIAACLLGGSQPRVIVRGISVSGRERSELLAHIVKLMRSHGYAISEQSIDMEGTI